MTGLLALLDDVASLLDDVATMTKVATKKTAGVLGDDLALNAEQVTGVASRRELPVVLAVARGSALNKVILVPVALALSFFLPQAILPLLMAGGGFLCFEGVEKLLHARQARTPADDAGARSAAQVAKARAEATDQDVRTLEKHKIKGAIRTDFILSAEILVIGLGTVAERPFTTQLGTLVALSVIVTVGVYGLVAGIVKLDDLGLYLERRDHPSWQRVGRFVVLAAPKLMKTLSIAGTAAMFLVGGGIIIHGIGPLHHLVAELLELPAGFLLEMLAQAVVGMITGGLLVLSWMAIQKLRGAASH